MTNGATPPPANEERGELELFLDGEPHVLRPTYEAIESFERITGRGLLELGRSAIEGKLTVGEAAQIAAECIRAWGRAVDNKSAAGVNALRVGELLFEAEGGFRAALGTIAGMLAMASTGGYTAQGEVRPAAMKMTSEVPAGD